MDANTKVGRVFETGAFRDSEDAKLDYEGFLSPLVLQRYAEYMNKHRTMRDGSKRDSDNWQRGIPLSVYMKSAWRHFMALWMNHRKTNAPEPLQEALCAILFNIQGYLHEVLRAKIRGQVARDKEEDAAPGSPSPVADPVSVLAKARSGVALLLRGADLYTPGTYDRGYQSGITAALAAIDSVAMDSVVK